MDVPLERKRPTTSMTDGEWSQTVSTHVNLVERMILQVGIGSKGVNAAKHEHPNDLGRSHEIWIDSVSLTHQYLSNQVAGCSAKGKILSVRGSTPRPGILLRIE